MSSVVGDSFKNHLDIVWPAIQLAVSCKIHIGKQGYVFILTGLKSDVFMFHS